MLQKKEKPTVTTSWKQSLKSETRILVVQSNRKEKSQRRIVLGPGPGGPGESPQTTGFALTRTLLPLPPAPEAEEERAPPAPAPEAAEEGSLPAASLV